MMLIDSDFYANGITFTAESDSVDGNAFDFGWRNSKTHKKSIKKRSKKSKNAKEVSSIRYKGKHGSYSETRIERVIYDGPTTIIYWSNGDCTVVKCREGEPYDRATGFAMAVLKRIYGEDFHYILKEFTKEDQQPSQSGYNQSVKADSGKAKLTLVPTSIIWDIARVREYGNAKYPEGGPDNWKQVEIERYRDAAMRHFLRYLDNPKGVDKESGLPHLWHLACNIAFLCEMERKENNDGTGSED